MASQSTTGFGGDSAARSMAQHGLADPEALAKVRARTNYYASMVPQVPARFRRLMDGRCCASAAQDWQLHRRLRPRAGAHLAALPGAGIC